MKKKFRDLSGVLLLDKTSGITSNRALQNVRFLFQAKKAGHTGTLDPFATGLLPICFGEANKFSRWLLSDRKTYVFTMKLGEKTDTKDCDGVVIDQQAPPIFTPDDLVMVEKKLQGEISQLPPNYSAIRVNGKRAYELARAGETFELKPRSVYIHSLKLQKINETLIKGIADVSKGTYIRVLVEDIAKLLNTLAFCESLRRVSVGDFLESQMYSFDFLEKKKDDLNLLDELLLPIDTLCKYFKAFSINEAQWRKLIFGQSFLCELQDDYYRLYFNDQFVGIAKVEAFYLKAFRLINTSSL